MKLVIRKKMKKTLHRLWINEELCCSFARLVLRMETES